MTAWRPEGLFDFVSPPIEHLHTLSAGSPREKKEKVKKARSKKAAQSLDAYPEETMYIGLVLKLIFWVRLTRLSIHSFNSHRILPYLVALHLFLHHSWEQRAHFASSAHATGTWDASLGA
jgi:hypothetical protein